MKNNFLKTFIVLLLTLTVITNVTFGINANSNGTVVSVCSTADDKPFSTDTDDEPRKP